MKTFATGFRRRLIPISLLLALLGLFFSAPPAVAAPTITLTPASGAVGTVVTLTGTMFDSYRGDNIYIYFDDNQIAESPVKVPEAGEFSTTFIIPENAAFGTHYVRAMLEPDSPYLVASGIFTVESTRLSIDTAVGAVGTTVTVTGAGFYANTATYIYYFNPSAVQVGTVTTTATGRFTFTYIIPDSVAGLHTISASNIAGNNAETAFEVIPNITLNTPSGGPGQLVSITGTGFGFRSDVSIVLGPTIVTTAQSNSFGTFDLSFNIPDINAGDYEVRAQDTEGNIDIVKLTVVAGVKLSATTGGVGSDVTVTGSGFAVGGTITVDIGIMRVATLTADNNGGFSTTFAVPVMKAGEHTVRVTDGSIIREVLYTIESVPPSAPTLLLPFDGTTARTHTYFEWSTVTDESLPVSYHLQVATDSNFSTVLRDIAELTEPEYLLAEDEALAGAASPMYYWRVRAIDAAGTMGAWSVTKSFIVAAPAVPQLTPMATPTEGEEPLVTLEANELLSLDWDNVTSTTGTVSYTLEIASDPDFNDVVLQKDTLESSDYMLTEEEMLELKNNIPYYWRVKAADSDGIESEWTEADQFVMGHSSTWPQWATWILVGIAFIVLTGGAYIFGRRKGGMED